MIYVILQSIEQKANYTDHIAHERQELCPENLLIVLVPVTFEEGTDEFGGYNSLVFGVVESLDEI